jgi:hypothetical protein
MINTTSLRTKGLEIMVWVFEDLHLRDLHHGMHSHLYPSSEFKTLTTGAIIAIDAFCNSVRSL